MRAGTRAVTVLVVDDQQAIRDVLRRILDKADNYAVAEASNVAEALVLIAKDPPDVVILDLSMPGGPGSGVISAIRRWEVDTKILVLSSHSEVKAEVLAMGAHVFLPKTSSSSAVLAALATLVQS